MRRRIIVAARLLLLLVCAVAIAVFACRFTPLGCALLFRSASSGNVLASRILILLGTDVNTRDAHQGTALFYAAGHAHSQVVLSLLQLGADASITNDEGNTAICYSIGSASPESLKCDGLLIAAGSLKNQKRPLSCTWGSRTASAHVKLLLENGIDPNAPNGAPLMAFAYNGDVQSIAILLEHGARINAVAADGRTALSEAVTQGNVDAVKYLVKHGADATVKLQGNSLIDLARSKRNELARAGAVAAALQYDEIIQFLEASKIGMLGH